MFNWDLHPLKFTVTFIQVTLSFHPLLRCVHVWVGNCVKTRPLPEGEEAGFTQFLTHKSTLLSTENQLNQPTSEFVSEPCNVSQTQ